ncbi:MAG: glycosyltransferase [Steroidobacteraceae bacterium]|nr:glycosyltransferase [Steroidobacteraceae bacterium]
MTTPVLFILDKFAGPTAGTEAQFWLLVSGLDRRVFDLRVATLQHSPFLAENLPSGAYTCLQIPRISRFSAWRRAFEFARRQRQDGVRVAHLFLNDVAVLFPLPLWSAGIRVLVSRRDLGFWYTPPILRALRLNRHFVSRVIANCSAVADVVAAHERFPRAKVLVVPNGVATPPGMPQPAGWRTRLGLDARAVVFVMVANLRRLKRMDDAVRALARVQLECPGAVLVVAGEDRIEGGRSVREYLESLAESLRVRHAVHLVGRVDEPWSLLGESDVLLSCSETEGLSNTIIEAMTAGLPVVATVVGGSPDLVTEGETGHLVAVGDVDALACAMRELATDRDARLRMAAAARQSARTRFAVSSMVAAYSRLYVQGGTEAVGSTSLEGSS